MADDGASGLGHRGLARRRRGAGRSRPDLHSVFAEVRDGHRGAFVRWLWTHGLEEGSIAAGLLPDPVATERGRGHRATIAARRSVNNRVIEAVRREPRRLPPSRRWGWVWRCDAMADALDAAGIPWTAIDYDRTSSRLRKHGGAAARSARAATSLRAFDLMLITPDQLGWFRPDRRPRAVRRSLHDRSLVLGDRRSCPTGPRRVRRRSTRCGARPSTCGPIFAAHTDRPVTLVPVAARLRRARSFRRGPGPARHRRSLHLPLHLRLPRRRSSARTRSVWSTPTAACSRTPTAPTRLVLKAINGDQCPKDAEHLADAISDRDDIELWDRYLVGRRPLLAGRARRRVRVAAPVRRPRAHDGGGDVRSARR